MNTDNNLNYSYHKKMFLLITVSTVIKFIIASTVELGSAEVYYWSYSLNLQWNYFDHPPVVAWLIRLTTANLLLHNELFVRIGAIISSAICTWLIFKIGKIIHNRQTGWYAALLYTSFIYGSLLAGTFILPDSPQMVFWLLSLLVLIRIIHTPGNNSRHIFQWCLFGLLSGLCIMSKVHGVFLWLGVIMYALFINRNWLKTPGLYLSAIITIIIISPIVIWNFQHDYANYTFHSDRINIATTKIDIVAFIKELVEVAFLVVNPINFYLIYTSISPALKSNAAFDKKDIQLLLFCSLPLLFILLFISIFGETKAYWPGPAYSCLLILPAIKSALAIEEGKRTVPVIIKVSLLYTLLLVIVEMLVINYYPGTTSSEKDGLSIGKDDLSLDMYGWEEAGKRFDSLYRSDVATGIMPAEAPVIITNWFPAAHIEFYIADRTKQQLLGIGNISDLHQYYYTNKYKRQLRKGDDAYFIVPSNLFNYKALDVVLNNFQRYEMPLVISQYRSGLICKKVYVFRIRGYKKS